MNLNNLNNNLWEKTHKNNMWNSDHLFPTNNAITFEKYHLKKKNTLLDLGCGSGENTIFFAKKGHLTYGLDISKSAIKKCQKKIINTNLKIKFKEGSFLNIPFKDNYFDSVFCDGVLYYSNKEEFLKAISEIYRVLKKGGIFRLYTKSNRDFLTKISKKISPNTYLITQGYEKKMIVYCISKNEIKKTFSIFKSYSLGVEEFNFIDYSKLKSFWVITAIK